jgi:hypothetical protein
MKATILIILLVITLIVVTKFDFIDQTVEFFFIKPSDQGIFLATHDSKLIDIVLLYSETRIYGTEFITPDLSNT